MLQKNKHYAFEFKKKSIQTGRSGNPRKQITPEAWKQAEEAFDIHTILDTVGFVPVIGEPADLVNGLIYVAEKDYINAGMPMAAGIPVVEDAGKAVKYGAKAVDKDSDIAKTLNAVRKPLAKNEGKQFKAAAKGIKKITKGKADKAVEIAKGDKAVGKDGRNTATTIDYSYKFDRELANFNDGYKIRTTIDCCDIT